MANIFVQGALFSILFLLVRPVMLGEPIDGRSVLVNTMVFVVWISLTGVITNIIVGRGPNMNDFEPIRADRSKPSGDVCITG